jgi:2-oxoisovalerate dehydrogenase E1 component
MPKVIPLTAGSEWVELHATDEDWDAASPALLETMLVQLHLIRAFEEEVLELAGQGLVHGPAHSSIGQEGGAVGSCLALRTADQVTGSHRGHHQFLSKAFGHVAPGGLTALAQLTPELREVLKRSLAEICGLSIGYCRGRGRKQGVWGRTPSSVVQSRRPPVSAGPTWPPGPTPSP